MKTKKLLPVIWLTLTVAILAIGCASLNPGADPFVVRVEQTQTAASATFDLLLGLDDSNRSFWISNTPAFHQFCETLRKPTPYQSSSTILTLPKCVVAQLNVDDLKLSYKSAKTEGNSNLLYSAWGVLNTLANQAQSWKTIVTVITPTHP